MATCNQRYQITAQRKKDNARTRGLEQRPHARGWVNRVTIVTPRKPNSAKRPVVKVFLRRGGRLTAHIPGIGHSLKKFSKILLRGRGPRDLPGVRYSGVRGVLDFLGLKKKKEDVLFMVLNKIIYLKLEREENIGWLLEWQNEKTHVKKTMKLF